MRWISFLWLVKVLPRESHFREIRFKNISVYSRAVTGILWSCMLLLIGYWCWLLPLWFIICVLCCFKVAPSESILFAREHWGNWLFWYHFARYVSFLLVVGASTQTFESKPDLGRHWWYCAGIYLQRHRTPMATDGVAVCMWSRNVRRFRSINLTKSNLL